MSKRSQIEEHLQKLNEIGDIMRAMKNVSLMEVHKLNRVLEHQQRVVNGIETAAADFSHHYASSARPIAAPPTHIVAIGAERGFCGDFNDAVIAALQNLPRERAPNVVTVGTHLGARLGEHKGGVRVFPGPNTVEEIPGAIEMLMRALTDFPNATNETTPLSLVVLVHQDGHDKVSALHVSALPQAQQSGPQESFAPLLYEPPPVVHSQLFHHYLWARMHQIYYSSLLAEHRYRVQHMESALQRMEEKTTNLRRRQNILRQEEITEEIEVIMLNSGVSSGRRRGKGSHPWQ